MAKRFRFRLETVRRLRKEALDQQRRAVADRVRAVAKAKARVDAGRRDLAGTVAEIRRQQHEPVLDVASIRSQQVYRGWLTRRIAEGGRELQEVEAALAEQRAKLGEASKRLKVIEKLHERQWQRHSWALRKEEQAVNDEVAVQQYVRRVGRMVGMSDS